MLEPTTKKLTDDGSAPSFPSKRADAKQGTRGLLADTDRVYVFHYFRVDPARRSLFRSGRRVSVTAKVFDLLLVLIRHRERVVTRAELMDRLWPDTTVEDGNLSVGISALRKALGAGPEDAPVIETLPRVGYRFVADVLEESSAGGRGV